MSSPESGHAERVRSYIRDLAAVQLEGWDLGDNGLAELAERLDSDGGVVAPWPVVQPWSEVMPRHRVSRSTAFELLRRYGQEANPMDAIDYALAAKRVRRALVWHRMQATGSSKATAERWVPGCYAVLPFVMPSRRTSAVNRGR